MFHIHDVLRHIYQRDVSPKDSTEQWVRNSTTIERLKSMDLTPILSSAASTRSTETSFEEISGVLTTLQGLKPEDDFQKALLNYANVSLKLITKMHDNQFPPQFPRGRSCSSSVPPEATSSVSIPCGNSSVSAMSNTTSRDISANIFFSEDYSNNFPLKNFDFSESSIGTFGSIDLSMFSSTPFSCPSTSPMGLYPRNSVTSNPRTSITSKHLQPCNRVSVIFKFFLFI